MKIKEYKTPNGATVTIRDPESPDFQQRLERATARFMINHLREQAAKEAAKKPNS